MLSCLPQSALGAALPCSLALPPAARHTRMPRLPAARHAVHNGSGVHARHYQRGCTGGQRVAVCVLLHTAAASASVGMPA